MLRYLRELSLPRLVLWCYLIWYLGVLVPYFDPNPKLWLSSFGISGIIGTGLYLSTAHAGPVKTVLKRWQIFRLFLMPLCVSSFAALIKGHGFFLVFHPSLEGNLRPAVACGVLGSVIWLVKRWRPSPSAMVRPT